MMYHRVQNNTNQINSRKIVYALEFYKDLHVHISKLIQQIYQI